MERLNEMRILTNEYHYQRMRREKSTRISAVMEPFLNIHHERNDIEDRTDLKREEAVLLFLFDTVRSDALTVAGTMVSATENRFVFGMSI